MKYYKNGHYIEDALNVRGVVDELFEMALDYSRSKDIGKYKDRH